MLTTKIEEMEEAVKLLKEVFSSNSTQNLRPNIQSSRGKSNNIHSRAPAVIIMWFIHRSRKSHYRVESISTQFEGILGRSSVITTRQATKAHKHQSI